MIIRIMNFIDKVFEMLAILEILHQQHIHHGFTLQNAINVH